MDALLEIQAHYGKAVDVALQEIERLARVVLQKSPCFTEFIMCMGTAWFCLDKDLECEEIWDLGFKAANYRNHSVYDCAREMKHPPAELLRLVKLFDEWNEYLKLTGTPMRFTATGEKITNW